MAERPGVQEGVPFYVARRREAVLVVPYEIHKLSIDVLYRDKAKGYRVVWDRLVWERDAWRFAGVGKLVWDWQRFKSFIRKLDVPTADAPTPFRIDRAAVARRRPMHRL